MYEIIYEPIWGTFTRYVEYVSAASERQAEIKFYCSKDGDNCQRIIAMTKTR